MKYMVVSDIHGSGYYAEKIREKFLVERADKLIVLGDIYYHGPRNPLPEGYSPKNVAFTLNQLSSVIVMIKGNCDSEVDECVSDFKFLPFAQMEICGKKFYFTHGHINNIDSYDGIDFDVMVYGHFHKGFITQKDDKIFANPGSVSLPKYGTENSYMIIDEQTKKMNIKNFSNKVITEKVVE